MAPSFLCTVLCLSALFLCASAVCNSPQVTCPAASSDQVPQPFYALTFDSDPTASVGGVIDYQWLATDTSETCAYLHSGVVYLGAAANSSGSGGGLSDGSGLGYIDLSATTGPNSAGTSLTALANVGSPSSGQVVTGTSGWSFEFTAKAFAITDGAKMFCMVSRPTHCTRLARHCNIVPSAFASLHFN